MNEAKKWSFTCISVRIDDHASVANRHFPFSPMELSDENLKYLIQHYLNPVKSVVTRWTEFGFLDSQKEN